MEMDAAPMITTSSALVTRLSVCRKRIMDGLEPLRGWLIRIGRPGRSSVSGGLRKRNSRSMRLPDYRRLPTAKLMRNLRATVLELGSKTQRASCFQDARFLVPNSYCSSLSPVVEPAGGVVRPVVHRGIPVGISTIAIIG